MAREHARVKLSIWDDEDFRALSPAAQHLYFVLLAHPKLDYCGVADWRPSRIVGFSAAWTVTSIEIAAQELSEARFIIIDTETEEVLLRSFVRNDEFMDQPNMAVAMKKAHRSISSAALRGIVVHELVRLHKDKPDLKGWAKVSELLDRPSFNPSDYPSFRASVDPPPHPSGKGETKPSANPSGQPSPTTYSLLPTPNSQLQAPPKNEDQDLGEERTETFQPANATKPPPGEEHCSRHPNGNTTGEPCRGCQRVEERRARRGDRNADEAARAAERAALTCTRCDGTWVTDEDTRLPTRRKCDHQPVRSSA